MIKAVIMVIILLFGCATPGVRTLYPVYLNKCVETGGTYRPDPSLSRVTDTGWCDYEIKNQKA
jgi:hypothetical protein